MPLPRPSARLACVLLTLAAAQGCRSRSAVPGPQGVHFSRIGEGWARSSVNAVVFRNSSVITHGDTQYTAYYDADGRMVLAKRRLGTDRWTVRPTRYTGDVRDAHNSISLGVDGRGVLHVAWNDHGQPLNYARDVRPGALELTDPLPMTGEDEGEVTYPQFFGLPDGDLLFVYRDGRSGSGNVMLNRYDVESGRWRAVAHPLIDGEGIRNAYVNPLAVDRHGGWHLSWTWRETPDVATNHDILYAYSPDEGRSWRTSSGRRYELPITAAEAEVVRRVPQGSELINQTSMTVDARGRPLIATYWLPPGDSAPQYQLVWFTGEQWRTSRIGHRTLAFRLSGGGTKRIPISRPQVLAGDGDSVYVVFRDEERGNGVTLAVSTDSARSEWRLTQLSTASAGQWEPSYDPVRWARDRELDLFYQVVGQGDAETLEALPPQPVSILEWRPR